MNHNINTCRLQKQHLGLQNLSGVMVPMKCSQKVQTLFCASDPLGWLKESKLERVEGSGQ